MTIENIFNTYGTHELDINFCADNGKVSTIFAYCHKHNIDGQFMINHYLKIIGKMSIVKADIDDESDVYIHIANIEKIEDNLYEINGVGGCVQLSANDDLIVEEISEEEYNKQLREA